MSTSSNATAHIDGGLDCTTIRVGILDTGPLPTPVATFLVTSGLQNHPIWALDRLAAVVYCYCQAIKSLPNCLQIIEINLTANLVSGPQAACIVANSITWHTSKAVRDLAEPAIARMIGDHARWETRWPSSEPLIFPVER